VKVSLYLFSGAESKLRVMFRALRLSFIASYILLMLSFHTGASGDALILSLGLAAKFTLPARAVLALLFVGASGWALASLARRSSFRKKTRKQARF
jgi:hypothetical protein